MNLNLVELPSYCRTIPVVVEYLAVPGGGAAAAVLSLPAQRTIHNMLEAAGGVFSSRSAFSAMHAGRQHFSLFVFCLFFVSVLFRA